MLLCPFLRYLVKVQKTKLVDTSVRVPRAHAAIRSIHFFVTPSKMKSTVLSLVLVAATGANAFVPASQAGVARGPSTSLAATADSSTNSLDRRTFTAGLGAFVAGTAVATSAMPVPAYAKDYNADYTPRFDDLKQIYVLGVTLDRLIEKIENAEK